MKVLRSLTKTTRNIRAFFAAEKVVLAPFTRDLRHYNLETFRQDAWAAANVTVLALAQGIAFAAIAGLPVVYGIISTAVAAFVAPLFAGSRHTILGPTNATAFMLFSFFAVNPSMSGRPGELIPLLVLMVGFIATVGALFRVADLLQYISRSVLVGYISGAAVLIVANQLKPFLGLDRHIGESTS
ncbi:MAG: SulP family inorganic anion transporter, partial [Verrucomicrobiaceae bacterium]